MGRGYQRQGHRPSSGLIHAPLQGVGAPRCVCVSHARHRGGGGMVAENCSGGGGLQLTEKGWMTESGKKKKEKKNWERRTPLPEIQCGAETPRSLVELNLLSH